MSIGLLFPAALAALAALLLPLLIHLTRRSDRQLMAFAALRWLRAKERARRRLRIDEWLLLALRLLLLTAVVLLLAQPLWFGESSERAWVVVVPGADPAALIDDPTLRDARWHWLAPGFPVFDNAQSQPPAATASLLRELDATLTASQSLTVIVPERLPGLDAQRITLSRPVDWRIVAARPDVGETEQPTPRTQTVAIRHDLAHAGINRYFTAAAKAWNAGTEDHVDASAKPSFVIDTATTDVALPANSDWLLWLSSEALSPANERWLAAGGNVLRASDAAAIPAADRVELWRSQQADTWLSAQRSGKGRLLIVHGSLDLAQLPELLNPEFPTLLHGWLNPPARTADRAMAKDAMPTQGMAAWPPRGEPLREAMIWLIAALWLLERLLASNRRKASRA
ncbi:MAG: BatA domain-containing protein [Xanthomonadaceae bacterium]|nr:BatA domain-containing protein [Xanthomonadaceae bacterium]MDP2186952.1 BatA domain-containing protein [Xanthomonadales bacterium]MDZ4116727.1 BatA domain-containing protein [Xanthomonadaceae bacterium]MDZ4379407.1 BatA domain-containing protein [Xanthomonadaceae bacterium]